MTATTLTLEQIEAERTRLSYVLRSKWSNRFIWAAIVQGLGATLITTPIVMPWVKPSISMVIAGGSAGTWFTVGYILYLTIGVIGVALTALFYHHFEVVMNKSYKGFANYLAWIHLILMNVGVAAATAILMYGGYFGGAAMLSTNVGGLGWTAAQVHTNILAPLVSPAGYAVIVAGIGVLAGGLGFVVTNFRRL